MVSPVATAGGGDHDGAACEGRTCPPEALPRALTARAFNHPAGEQYRTALPGIPWPYCRAVKEHQGHDADIFTLAYEEPTGNHSLSQAMGTGGNAAMKQKYSTETKVPRSWLSGGAAAHAARHHRVNYRQRSGAPTELSPFAGPWDAARKR